MSIKVKALTPHYYSRQRTKDEEYQADEKDLFVLKALNLVEVVDDKPKRTEYRRKDLRAQH